MKYVKQFAIIVAISFFGEILNRVVPLPVPASIYGLVIMFLCLEFKVIKVEQVKETSSLLLSIMPLFFVPSSVSFINAFPVLKKYGAQFVLIAFVTTFAVMIVTGHVAQFIIRMRGKKK